MSRRRLRLVQVAVAVIERRGRYLISRRRLDDHLGGYWEFPGGKRKVGESWPACLRRELEEELGIGVRLGARLEPIRFRYSDRTVLLQPFRCAIIRGAPKPLQTLQVAWASPAQLRRRKFPPADRPLLERLAAVKLRRRRGPAILIMNRRSGR